MGKVLMATCGAQPSGHLVFSTSTSALQSYEKHVKKDGVTVELLSFSEQSELDAEKLKRKLDDTSQSSHVTVLLLLTGASSYLWFDTEHQPRNVELCNLLKQRFPEKLQFVICPTSKATHDAWKAHKPQLQSIFGPFFSGNNVCIWAGFDRDVDSTTPICSLIRKESAKAKSDVMRKGGEKNQFPMWFHRCIIPVLLLLAVVYFTKSYFALETKMTELQERFDKSLKQNEDLSKGLETMQSQNAELQKHFDESQKENEGLLTDLRTAQSQNSEIQARFDASQKRHDGLSKELRITQGQNAEIQEQLDASQKEKAGLDNKLKRTEAQKDECAKRIQEKEKEHGDLQDKVQALQAKNQKLLEEAAKETSNSYMLSAKEYIFGMGNHSF